MAKRSPTKFTKKFYLDERHPKSYIEIPVKPGKHTVHINRIEADVLGARAGSSIACMNHQCVMREGAAGKFPHPVYFVVFDTTMAYVVDQLTPGLQPKSAIRYKHNDREGVKLHDKYGPKKIAQMGLAEKEVVLSPPEHRIIKAGRPNFKPSSREGTKTHKLVIPNGTRKRAMAAGILVQANM